MRKEVLVSICIPTYNQTIFLKKTVDSIAEQTFRDFEVIVSDDSTTAEVKKLVDSFGEKLTIHYHHNNKPLGSPANWNRALDLAKGSLIKIMHHDDWFAGPGSLQEFVNAIEQDKSLAMVFCKSEICDEKENRVLYNEAPRSFLQNLQRDPRTLFNNNRIGAPSATMFRRSSLRFDEKLKYLVDIEFYFRILKNGKFYYIDKPLIINTAGHPGQVTAASMNREVQIGEFSYLYNKFFEGKITDFRLSRFFVNLFLQYKLKQLSEITHWGYDVPRPEWWFGVLLNLSKVKRTLRAVTGRSAKR